MAYENNKNYDYFTQRENKNNLLINEMLKECPKFFREFIIYLTDRTLSLTRINYINDIKLFLNFLMIQKHEDFPYDKISDFTIKDMQKISAFDIEEFLNYITIYKISENVNTNHEAGKSRKLSTLRSFFKFLYKREYLEANPAQLIDYPKIREKVITKLDEDEISRLLDMVDRGSGLTEKQKTYHSINRSRDMAIITLLLGTGIRISECVGINLRDINFDDNSFKITRKGGNETILYFGNEVSEALQQYLLQRENIIPEPGHENAFFLSMQNKRITPRTIQNMVKKYTLIATPLKKITPHKLRSSYGTLLYKETGDIYLVADVLGHRDVNTTKRHYAKMDIDRRKLASEVIKLKGDDNTDSTD